MWVLVCPTTSFLGSYKGGQNYISRKTNQMSNYNSLKATINANVKTNGNQEITGSVLNSVLNAMVNTLGAGYQYAGVATPSSNPGTPDTNVFYIAATAGTYTNMGGLVVSDGEVAILKYNGTWTKDVTGVATLSELRDSINELRGKVSELDVELNGSPEQTITDFSGYTRIPGVVANGVFQNSGPYGARNDVILIPVSEYRNRRVYFTPTTNSAGTGITVLKDDYLVNGESPHYATGWNNTVVYFSTVYLDIPEDASYLLVKTTSSLVDTTPVSLRIPSAASSFYNKTEVDSLISALNDAIDDLEESVSIQTEETPEATSSVLGRVFSQQTIGQPVDLREGTGFGYIYTFDVPAGGVAKITFTDKSGNYGFALCDSQGIVLEWTTNYNAPGMDYTFARQNADCVLYASSNKLGSIVISQNTTLKEVVEDLQEQVENQVTNRWAGKTIWWCGTSIPAGKDETIPGADETIAGNYPTEVGNDLKANVINKAVGASMCRANVRTGDYVGANFSNITSCLSMTRAEAEAFIANYDNIKGSLTGNPPATLDATYIARLRAASFEERLLPYLNGTYPMPDLFVIDHGHNDFKYTLPGGGSDIGLLPIVANIGGDLAEDTYMTANNNAKLESFFGSLANIPAARKAEFIASVNRNCYIGAVNFIVTLILHYNPHARILFISNYEYENGASPQYAPLIPAQETLAKSWAFPLCEVYKYLGFSNHLIPGSMAWFNTTYPNVTPATTDVTAYRAYLPDNVHPHSDTTGDANNNYAGIISEFIKKIY